MEKNEEYQKALKDYMAKVMPNCPYNGMIARWGWKLEQEQLFKEEYINNNKKKE